MRVLSFRQPGSATTNIEDGDNLTLTPESASYQGNPGEPNYYQAIDRLEQESSRRCLCLASESMPQPLSKTRRERFAGRRP